MWASYIYSPALPLLLPIGFVNLLLIYWIDKIFVLRLNKTPMNYDEKIISVQMYLLKLTFPFHLIGGLFLLSNSAILQSGSVENQN